MVELYLKMMMLQQSNKFEINFNQQIQMYNVKFLKIVQPPPPSLSTSHPVSSVNEFPSSVPLSVYSANSVTSTPLDQVYLMI